MAVNYGQDWDIKACGGQCAKTERPFADGESFMSRIVFGDAGYLREDYGKEAWDKTLQEGALSYWTSVHKIVEKEEKVDVLGPESAEKMLRDLMEAEDPEQVHTMYVLALMLERKRILIEKDVKRRKDGLKLRCYEHKQSGEAFVIPDPDLRLDEMEEIQIQVARALGWKPPEERNPPPVAAAPAEGEADEASADEPDVDAAEDDSSDEEA